MQTISKLNKSIPEPLLLAISFVLISITMVWLGFLIGSRGYSIFFWQEQTEEKHLSDIYILDRLISKEYVSRYNQSRNREAAMRALVAGLDDPYSFYISKAEFNKYSSEEQGTGVGAGFTFLLYRDYIQVFNVYQGSGADKVGIKPGTIITAINDTPINEYDDRDYLVRLLKHARQPFSVTYNFNDETISIRVVPETFEMKNIEYSKLTDQVGYLKFIDLGGTIETEMAVVTEFLLNSSVDSVILDLRSVLGGRSDADVFLVDQFVDSGTILTTTGVNDQTTTYRASKDAPLDELEVVILVDKYTASAAEVVTAALSELADAQVFGQNTKGKDTQQNIFRFKDGSAVNLTTARWQTPNGNSLAGIGVTPNQEVLDDPSTPDDEVIEAALSYLAD